ncbi:MAG: PEP-CTERM sorting domain-containing protein, partial [Thermogutta sp.]|uniref:PEP-CTERM sorting domain-containing protein n=1 Tax=Thermogutta sp. TaxID=1962930 RepID=UPI0019863AE5
FQLEPNPLWEEITLMLPFVPVGQYFLIDRFHVATECIPEPSTVSLAVLGAFGLIWTGRKRTKSVLRN